MTCKLNENLHRRSIDRSNRFYPEQFLHQDHWITPKSREHDKDIWSIVRLQFGPLATPPYKFHELIWRTIATTCINRPTTYTQYLTPLWRCTCIWHALADQGTSIESIKHHLDQGTHTIYSWLETHQTSFGHIITITVNTQYKHQLYKLIHHYMIELTKILHFECYWVLAICLQIFYISCSTTILDRGVGPSDT